MVEPLHPLPVQRFHATSKLKEPECINQNELMTISLMARTLTISIEKVIKKQNSNL